MLLCSVLTKEILRKYAKQTRSAELLTLKPIEEPRLSVLNLVRMDDLSSAANDETSTENEEEEEEEGEEEEEEGEEEGEFVVDAAECAFSMFGRPSDAAFS